MRLQAPRRAVALGFVLVWCVLRFWLMHLRGRMTLERRARWAQLSSRQVLSTLGVRRRVEGQPPTHGLVVSNHLSYLDILIISSAMPCFFVSKVEIGGWPYFGEAARSCGTIFLDRTSMASAMSVADQMTERLKMGVPVLLFPEGTSTDGSRVWRFHSRLIDPATSAGMPITAASVRYVVADGTPERELCWFGDASFLPHLWKALGAGGFTAEVHFGEPRIYPDRRTAADATHDEISAMRGQRELVLQ